jgi:hypothetical protein
VSAANVGRISFWYVLIKYKPRFKYLIFSKVINNTKYRIYYELSRLFKIFYIWQKLKKYWKITFAAWYQWLFGCGPSKLVQAIMLSTCVREVTDSNTDFIEWGFLWLFSVSSDKFRFCVSNYATTSSFYILYHCLLFIQSFSATKTELLVLSLNKP